MKKLFLASVFLFLVFAFGCQESSITNPSIPDATQLQDNGKSGVTHNIISIKCDLSDPVRGNLCELTGKVIYNNQFLPTIGLKYYRVKVGLIMHSRLCNKCGDEHPLWEIKGKSDDVLLFDRIREITPTLLRKTYKISNRHDIELCVIYQVTPWVVKVKDINLRGCIK